MAPSDVARTVTVLTLLVAGALSVSSTAGTRERPLLWALHGASNTVYIAGSMHMLRAADATLSEGLDRAYADAERIVMELDTDDLDETAAARFTLEHGSYPPGSGRTLRNALGEERWRRINVRTEAAGLPLAALNNVEPWVVGITYSVLQMQQLGLDPKLGVEQQLTARAKQDHKPISGLETLEQQLALFADLSEAQQIRFLDLTVEQSDDTEGQIAALTRAWQRGNEKQLSDTLLHEYRRFPELYDLLVSRRNAAWIPQIKALLHGTDDYLIVVGALHLVGARGVIHLLERDGLRPQRVTH